MRMADARYARVLMTPTSPDPRFTIRDGLRRTTRDAHARVDGLLAGGLAAIADYAVYLRGMQRFIGDAAERLDDVGYRAQRDLLTRDLADLRLSALDRDTPADPIVDTDARLGWQYVIEGSSLGARLLARDAAKLGFDETHGARFLSSHRESPRWPALLARLEHATSPDRLRDAAQSAFAAAERALRRALATPLEAGR